MTSPPAPDPIPQREPFPLPIRILSDLHLGHSGCLIESVEQIRPLLDGAATVIFNGDTLEERADVFRKRSRRLGDDLAKLIAALGIRAVSLSGNHDPAGGIHYLDLPEHRTFITHGDAFFRYISPWSKKIHLSKARIDAIREEYSCDDLRDLDTRMEFTKRACREMSVFESEMDRGILAKMWTLMAEMWPPRRPWAILASWWTAPRRGYEFIRTYRPDADLLVFGHTHLPGTWKRGDYLLANTGGYLAVLNARVIEITEDGVFVSKVVRDGSRFVRQNRGYRLALRGAGAAAAH